MTRSFFSVIAIGIAGLAFAPAFLEGCQQTGVGDPCTPEQEYDTQFNGFAYTEVNVESKSFQCQTRLCLVNHFQGRVSCPYGQGPNKEFPGGGSKPYTNKSGDPIGACGIPGSKTNADGSVNPPSAAIEGAPNNTLGATVPPQCLDRTADKAVYCSCRCANVDGNTNDGANYCKCPDGYQCTQLVTPIGPTDTGLTGAYCVRSGTVYDPTGQSPVCSSTCDATQHNCG